MRKILSILAASLLIAGISGCNLFSGTNLPEADTTPPSKVSNLQTTAGDSTVLLEWTNPSDSDFYGVEITAKTGTTEVSKIVVLSPLHQHLFSNLTNGTEYSFSAVSLDKSLNKAEAATVAATPAAAIVPPVTVENATGFSAESIESKKVNLSWTKPASDFYAYNLTYYPTADASKATSVVIDKKEKSYTVSKLTNDTEYTFVLKVFDSELNFSSGVTVKCTPKKPIDYVEPLISESRTESLDYIFDTSNLGYTEITITREEWNQMLEYYDLNPKNETCVHADYKFTKGDKTWKVQDVGLRIRGNTSRARPQITSGAGKNDYQQAHFKIILEEWRDDGTDVKISNCLKSVMLKRFKTDPTYSREIFGYNMFRENGVWISPRAAYTSLKINIVDNKGEENESVEEIPYGVYAMIEQIDKQFLKERADDGKLKSNGGNLWKCTYPANFKNYSDSSLFGVEDVQLDETLSSRYAYDLKSNKDTASTQITLFKKWMKELNSLKTSEPENIKAWYEQNMDVDLFLKTYAINVLLGMWDDYWINNNNFYMYFDTDGKAYFVPYDYDNILGVNGCSVESGTQNPLKWGSLNDGSRPLIQKLFCVDEYKEKYAAYLDELVADDSWFQTEKSIARISAWQLMIEDYIDSPKLTYSDTYSTFDDFPATWSSPYVNYKLLSEDDDLNYFTVRINAVKNALHPKSITVTINAGDGNISYSPGYTEEKTYTINGGSGLKLSDYQFNLAYSDHKLVGLKNEAGKTVSKNSPIYDSCTLTAEWKELEKFTVKFYDNDQNTLLKTIDDISEGTYVNGLYNGSFPTYEGNTIFYFWKDMEGNIATLVSEDAYEFYAETIEKTQLPVVYNSGTPDKIYLLFDASNYNFSNIWLTGANMNSDMDASEIVGVHARGTINDAHWTDYDQINLSYIEGVGMWGTDYEILSKYYEENCFKFYVDWDTDGDGFADDHSWVDYWRIGIELPSNFLFKWDDDNADDYKYKISEFISIQE